MSTNRRQQPASLEYTNVAQFLRLVHLPARFCTWQTAAMGGFEPQHIPLLVRARLLKPLGNPPPNAPKYFGRDYVLRLFADERWLERASNALVEHWAIRNAKKSKSKKTLTNHSRN